MQLEHTGAPIHAVVIDRIFGDKTTLAKAAATVLGVTAYDVRASLHAPDGGPAVIATFADPDHAAATVLGLERIGIAGRVVDVDPHPAHVAVRGFELTDRTLIATDRAGRVNEVAYDRVGLLLRATAMTTTETTTTTRQRKFDLGRAALSGGLINTKVHETQTTSRATETVDLLVVWAGVDLPLRMADTELLYQGLGAAIQPSRTANFQYMVEQLRQRCPGARFDERLRHRAAQTQLLGHTLSPDSYLDFAIGLVADSLRGR